MKKRMIIVTALIMGTLGAGCVSVQASDTLPELTKDNALEQMMKAGETLKSRGVPMKNKTKRK